VDVTLFASLDSVTSARLMTCTQGMPRIPVRTDDPGALLGLSGPFAAARFNAA
jgi:hypothetical protein